MKPRCPICGEEFDIEDKCQNEDIEGNHE